MIASCEANRVRLGIAYYRHFYPAISRVKEIIDLGRSVNRSGQINAFERFDPLRVMTLLVCRAGKAGGGPMMDFGCHRIEI